MSNSKMDPSKTNSSDNITTDDTLEAVSTGHSSDDVDHTVAYVAVPLGALAVVVVIAFIVMLIVRRNRIERLRHHLMPLYNFDPQEEDWESELLDDRGRRMYNKEGHDLAVICFNYSEQIIVPRQKMRTSHIKPQAWGGCVQYTETGVGVEYKFKVSTASVQYLASGACAVFQGLLVLTMIL